MTTRGVTCRCGCFFSFPDHLCEYPMFDTNRDPTTDEIAEHCLRFQSTWTDEERLSRLSGHACKLLQSDFVSVEREAAYALESRLSATQMRTGGVFGSHLARTREQ